MVIIISVESCPGGGKGFFLKYMNTHIRTKYPALAARCAMGLLDDTIGNMLDFTNDPGRWAMFNQLVYYLKHYKSSSLAPVVFVEGSLDTDVHCVTRYFQDKGYLHEKEADVLRGWHDRIIRKGTPLPDAIIYLENTVHHHFERVVHNSKREQAHFTRTMLAAMKIRYDEIVSAINVPTLRIRCIPHFEDNEPVLTQMAHIAMDFLQRHVFKDQPIR